MTYVAAGASLLGTFMQVQGARAQAKGQAAAAEYNARIKERNALALDYEADWANIVGGMEIQEFLDDADRFNATVSSANRKNGWTPTGTALDVLMDSIAEQEEEVANRKTGIIAAQRNLEEQGINMRMGAELDSINAHQYRTAGRYRAYGAAFGGISRTAMLLR